MARAKPGFKMGPAPNSQKNVQRNFSRRGKVFARKTES